MRGPPWGHVPRGGEGRGPGCQLAPTVAAGGLRLSQPVLSLVKHLTTNTSLDLEEVTL